MPVNLLREIEVPVRDLLSRRERLVLAVSGGRDSAVLLEAVARLRSPGHHIVVATLDHGTGEHATRAAELTVATATGHGIGVVTERLRDTKATEADWRRLRWRFLKRVAQEEDAVVVTAHTRDDQVETVVMRLLRGTGPRGLAGLYAPSSVERPLLSASRHDVQYYARARHVTFVDDPSNLSVRFLRNRVRLNLLPAIRAVRPGFDDELLDLAHRAAQLRVAVDRIADDFVLDSQPSRRVSVDAELLRSLDEAGRRLVWPSLAAVAGITLDRRGVERLSRLPDQGPGTTAQISGGHQAVRVRGEIRLHRRRAAGPTLAQVLKDVTVFGGFRFQLVPVHTYSSGNRVSQEPDDPWRFWLDQSSEVVVRKWFPGDRLIVDSKGARRRVKRFLAEAEIPVLFRRDWPVVVVGGEVVWIPGIRRGYFQPGRGPVVECRCERLED